MYENPMLAKFTLCKPCKFAYSSVCEKAENRFFNGKIRPCYLTPEFALYLSTQSTYSVNLYIT